MSDPIGLVLLREDASQLADVVGASLKPMAAGSFVEDIDNEEILAIFFRHRDGAVDLAYTSWHTEGKILFCSVRVEEGDESRTVTGTKLEVLTQHRCSEMQQKHFL